MSSPAPKLKLDWATHEAATHAVVNWHYSRRMPAGKLVRVGAWEDGRFIGVVLFGGGAAPEIGTPFGLAGNQVCELVRVALREHRTPVSRIVAIALRMLAKKCPGLDLVVSFADSAQGHHGGIYQAGGWTYVGSEAYHMYRVFGELVHPRTLGKYYERWGAPGQSIPWLRANVDPHAERVDGLPKHKYVMPLTPAGRAIVAPLGRPYPKRTCAGSIGVDAPGHQPGEGGSTPTSALHPTPPTSDPDPTSQ